MQSSFLHPWILCWCNFYVDSGSETGAMYVFAFWLNKAWLRSASSLYFSLHSVLILKNNTFLTISHKYEVFNSFSSIQCTSGSIRNKLLGAVIAWEICQYFLVLLPVFFFSFPRNSTSSTVQVKNCLYILIGNVAYAMFKYWIHGNKHVT